MNEPGQHEEVLFEAAVQLSSDQQRQYLDQACAGDPALRRRLEILLGQHRRTDGILDRPYADAPGHILVANHPLTEKVGDRISTYKLLQQIGEGGCGVVWMAEQESPVRRRVALKVIKLGMDTRQVVARFEAERQALALMDHPNIAKVFDAGATETGRPFFVMELVRGIKITDYCEQHELGTNARLGLFTRICHAIQHAHQKGIIHRDIKPSNLLIADHDGVPVAKVIDFGIAKATTDQPLTDKTLFTAFEQFIGTPAYMSPEQANLSGLDLDTRTDIYSLGVLLYELLTGETPFNAKELLQAGLDEMRRTIREVEPVKPSTRLTRNSAARHTRQALDTTIPVLRGDLDWIVMRCLEKDRSRRYETADALALDVQHFLDHEPVTARPPSNLYRLKKLVQRNRIAFAASSAISVTLLLAVVFLVFSNARTRQERNQKDVALRDKAGALEAAHRSGQRAKDELFKALRNEARARRYSRQMGQRLESLAAVKEAARIQVDATLRDEAIAALALPDVRLGPTWPVSQTNCIKLTCDALGQRYAMLDRQGVIRVRRIADDREMRRFETGRTCVDCYTSLAFSPDGRYLVNEGDGQPTFVWSLESGQPVLQEATKDTGVPSFSADGQLLALASMEDVVCIDLATGRKVNRWQTDGHVHSLQFHPTDRRIAVGFKDGPWVSVYDAENGREVARLEVGDGWRMVMSWHPEGRYLAVGSTALGIQVWDVEAQQRVARLESHAREVDFLTYHPSGNWLASWTWEGVMELWEPTTGRMAMQIPLMAELKFSRDGRWLGFFWPSEDRAQLLELIAPLGHTTLQDTRPGRKSYNACAVSPDDHLLAVATDDGLQLWDLPAGRKIGSLPSGHNETVLFEPNGQALWTCATNGGLQRWAIHPSSSPRPGLVAGAPERIELPFAPTRLAADRAVQTLAVISKDSGQLAVVDAAAKSLRSPVLHHPLADFIALSPDAKWQATSGWHTDHCRLWNARTGELLKDWIVGKKTRVGFTPEGRELILALGSKFTFLNVETLETSRQLKREIGLYAGEVAFSPDGGLMAMEMSPAVIHLKDVATGQTVGQLEDPFGDRSNSIAFSHDGARLIVLSPSGSAIHVWDLRALRTCLKEMGLDWDWPEFR